MKKIIKLAIDKDGVVPGLCRFRHHGHAVMALNEEEDGGSARLFWYLLYRSGIKNAITLSRKSRL
ncbi:hypothetical protein KCP69_23205 [Salmonella enterica subsp. enterica]|nr:hypothetical protein KCP69_23205 [Salmonella enterica subsp. enterica]